MTEHITIPLDAENLERARREAQLRGVSLETYLSRLIQGNLPAPTQSAPGQPSITAIFGIGTSTEPTDIGQDKDRLLDDALWREHLRKTRQNT